VVAQVILSVILLTASGLFIRTILHFQSVDPGFNTRDVMIVSASVRKQYGSDEAKGIDFNRRSLDLVRSVPGVSSAAWAAGEPLEPGFGAEIRTDSDKPTFHGIDCNFVTPGYLKTVGIPMLRGREFDEHDNKTSPQVMIVNETMAHRYWPNQVPLGKRVEMQWPGHGVFEVVGVARQAKYGTLWEEAEPFAYFLGAQTGFPPYKLHVKASGDPRGLFDPIRKAIQAAEPGAQVGPPRLVSELVSSSLSQERALAGLLGVFGAIGLLVTAVGLYGMISFVTAQRTREFGIRTALGARRGELLRGICGQGAIPVLIGLGVALPSIYGLTRFIQSRLHGIGPFDLPTYAAISLLCIAVSFVATLIPARRATANPTNALRSE
jgi:putative ABC transport system permease protein